MKKLVVNFDVSNPTFWHTSNLVQLTKLIVGAHSYPDVLPKLKPVKNNVGKLCQSNAFAALKRLHKTEIQINFRDASKGKPALIIPLRVD